MKSTRRRRNGEAGGGVLRVVAEDRRDGGLCQAVGVGVHEEEMNSQSWQMVHQDVML